MIRIIREDPDALPPEPQPAPAAAAGGASSWWMYALGALVVAAVAAGAFLYVGTGADSKTGSAAAVEPRPTAAPTPVSQGLLKQAEAQFVPRMSQPLADLVRAQPWYQELTPEKLDLLSWLLKCEQAARAQGEQRSVSDLFQFATEQAWYLDGLDDYEAKGLRGVVQAYERSLTTQKAPLVGASAASTLRHRLFDAALLPESGEVMVIAAAKDPALGRKALDIAVANLPRVEGMVGKYPYAFLYIEVTPEIEDYYEGASFKNEFLLVAPGSVTPGVLVHELTHATVYGLFPIWFEEGLAYVTHEYLTGDLSSFIRGVARTAPARAVWLDVYNYGYYTTGQWVLEQAGGLLLLNAIFETVGPEAFSNTVKALRTKTYNDNELLARILELAPEDKQPAIRKLYCDRVVGTTRNYCVGR
ncbi:MAG TPA: hypothetical protein VNN10_05400 [Dehalococcoidia bacterium]|nr:hypothetical protein [Dehalococcoidia bacterium]